MRASARTHASVGTRTTEDFLRPWTASVTAGELLGFCAPALVGPLVWDARPAIALPALMAAGVVEGAVLGWSQARVLRGPLPALSRRRWIVGTAVGASIAYLFGMLPSTTYGTWSSWPVAAVVVVGIVVGGLLLCSIGVAQWLELRRHLASAGLWVLASAAAWAVGLTAFVLVSTPLWQPGQGPVLVAAIGALGGLVMAATMAITTGLAMRHLLRRMVP
ncbi:hypothetical protein [Pengzhenrongella frigida]|uniref:Uncharacterized protein n=1 Tax=Pengzhenrongella frigida TaxID=1259133 RepID=A0A4Q5N0E1_9MICO|nr:hypothetical protein [Cellulomonas sp. HLT2-17]RYV51612.1 hypothetical protein EUA98_07750 [Cellulomonas sp. HLT2-17]